MTFGVIFACDSSLTNKMNLPAMRVFPSNDPAGSSPAGLYPPPPFTLATFTLLALCQRIGVFKTNWLGERASWRRLGYHFRTAAGTFQDAGTHSAHHRRFQNQWLKCSGFSTHATASILAIMATKPAPAPLAHDLRRAQYGTPAQQGRVRATEGTWSAVRIAGAFAAAGLHYTAKILRVLQVRKA